MRILKKLTLFGCLLLSLKSSIFGNACYPLAPRVETKASYFIFASQKLRDLYNSGGFEVQLSGSYPLKNCMHIYGSVGFLEASGKSAHFNERSTLFQIPVDLGLKPIVPISSSLDWYTAFGPRYFYVHQHNHSDFVDKYIRKSGLGLFVNTGFDFHPTQHCFITLFGEYSYEPIKPSSSKRGVHKRNTQVGGFNFGAGIGYSF